MSLRHILLSMLSTSSATPLPIRDTEPSFVPEPRGRGTIGLLTTSLFTLILCIWTATHPDVVITKSRWYRFLYKSCWAFMSAIFPEFLVCCAFVQWWRAKRLHKKWIKAWGDREEKDWLGMTGAFFVVMGGYCLIEETRRLQLKETTTEDQDREPLTDENPAPEGEIPLLGRTITARAEMGQNVIWRLTAVGMEQLLKTGDKLDGGLLKELIDRRILTKRHFDCSEIEDKSKAGIVSKALIGLQMLWVVFECGTRKAQNLPITLLEFHVLIQIPYTIFAYICWWFKPLDVAVPITLPIPYDLWPTAFRTVTVETFTSPSRAKSPLRRVGVCGTYPTVFAQALFDFCYHLTSSGEKWSAVMAALNGGIHAIASHFHFPHVVEMWFWRASCIGVAALPGLLVLFVGSTGLTTYPLLWFHRVAVREQSMFKDAIHEFVRTWSDAVRRGISENGAGLVGWGKRFPKWGKDLIILNGILWLLAYIVADIFLTVEAFISMRKLPQGAYSTPVWTDYFPHV